MKLSVQEKPVSLKVDDRRGKRFLNFETGGYKYVILRKDCFLTRFKKSMPRGLV